MTSLRRNLGQRVARKLGLIQPTTRSRFRGLHERLASLHRAEGSAFFFLQIGANDGISNDPIHGFVDRFAPAGLLVEPLPDVFTRLRATYAGPRFAKLLFLNAAIHAEASKVPLYRIATEFEPTYRSIYKPQANASGVTSLDRRHVRDFLLKVASDYFTVNDVDKAIETVSVPAMSVERILGQFGVRDVSFAQIDAEGYDGTIVDMLLNLPFERPLRIINFESSSMSEAERGTLFERLRKRGYSLFHERSDTCACL